MVNHAPRTYAQQSCGASLHGRGVPIEVVGVADGDWNAKVMMVLH